MKISINWLAEYVDIKGLSAKEISEGLRFSGTENFLEESASFENIVVGEIKEITKHPNADKLSIAQVAISENPKSKSQKLAGEVLNIVCGATNIKVGQKIPVALSGAKFGDFEISKVKIRGVESNGMLCSEKELELGDDHSGIMILGKDAKVGQKFSDYLGSEETIIDAELTPNRGDCLSMVGIAQEVSATFKRKLKLPKFFTSEVNSNKKVEVEVIDKELCPRYIAKVIEGIKIEPSPEWIQKRLLAAGVRPISNVVDVTNYVMLEWGQPLHAFDYDKLQATSDKQQGKKIVVRRAKKGETIETLDGTKRELSESNLVIADAKKPIAVAGVMGGANTEVDEKTTTIILEAAVFEGESVRKTAQRHANRTEASNRFEKGVPLQLPEIAIERAAELLLQGLTLPKQGETLSGLKVGANTDVLSSWIWVQHVGLRLSSIEKVLGVKIEEEKIIEILKNLGFSPEKFDFRKEARKHVGKPYVFGAKYKTHGDMAFDCSYLTDYIYSLIGKFIGYTSLAQYEIGKPVADDELQPGDVLFVRGHIDKSVTDHYYVPENHSGLVQHSSKSDVGSLGGVGYKKVTLDKEKEVGHNGIYIGGGRVIHARHYEYDTKNKKWKKLPTEKAKVVEEDVSAFLENPEYLGARRYVENPNDFIKTTVPWWRLDVKIEEDLLEEIVRIYGYDKLPSTLPSGEIPKPEKNTSLDLKDLIKERLVGDGYSEVITYSFVSENQEKYLEEQGSLKITNPISKDQTYMRSSLIPSLLEVAVKNQENFEKIKVFEIAKVYEKKEEVTKLALLVKLPTRDKSKLYTEIKGAIEGFIGHVAQGTLDVQEITISSIFGAGQGAKITLNKKPIGEIGIVKSEIEEELGLKGSVAVAEISFEALLANYGRNVQFKPLPKFPVSKRDVNMIFEKRKKASEIISAINNLKTNYLLDFMISDIYQGKGLPENAKSVTIRLIIGSNDGTLTDEQIKETEQAVVEQLERAGGKLRS
ncbi:phenylalanine--tRNA ligase subunit beta [Patescibacteria group bacterium]|nr:phenylalanine--tRNA ligase subunit beta [Patescibacteria group bacterium]